MVKGKRAKKRLGAWIIVAAMVINCLMLTGRTVEAAGGEAVNEPGQQQSAADESQKDAGEGDTGSGTEDSSEEANAGDNAGHNSGDGTGDNSEDTGGPGTGNEETPEQIIESTEGSRRFTADGQFTINVDGIITGYVNDSTPQWNGEVIIPARINNVEVKGLSGTFKGNTAVTSVIIPDTVVAIGDDTFNGCTGFQAMYVYDADGGKSKKDIQNGDSQWIDWSKYIRVVGGEITFYEIIGTGSCVVIPAGLSAIGNNVFNGCNFASFDVMDGNTAFCDSNEGGMNLPEGVGACLMSADRKKLYRLAPGFRDRNNSLQYVLPEGIEEIYPYAINKTGLQEVMVSATVIQIDEYAFYESNLLRITFVENAGVTTIGMYAFAYNQNLDIVLPPSVTTIASYCFAGITNRTPDISKTQITVLPAYTFAECPNLHTITMPATLLSVEAYAFAGNVNLEEVVFLGERLDKIGTGAFQGCQNMHKIDIPEGVTNIENDTFNGCTNLNTIILPDSLEIIGDNAFKDCQNIHEMVIPENVTYISNSSFDGVSEETLKNIDTSKNQYAQQLISQAVLPGKGEKVTIGNLIYQVTASDVQNGTVTVVSAINKKQKTITIPSTIEINGYIFKVTAIANKAFQKNTKLKTVTIGENVKTIGKEAFKQCKNLKNIKVKSKVVTKVNKNAFKGIHKKATIKLPKMPAKKLKKYKKKFASKGQAKTVKIK
ncbi:MAG: leucine-rich repeat domain-containing protein [Clostridium sp.]|nr:leucine-rich repeat domain-containing protein [Clostridium sp.]